MPLYPEAANLWNKPLAFTSSSSPVSSEAYSVAETAGHQTVHSGVKGQSCEQGNRLCTMASMSHAQEPKCRSLKPLSAWCDQHQNLHQS